MRTRFATSGPTGRLPIAGGASVVAIGLMAWDHLWGNERGSDDPFPVDPTTFLVTIALIGVTGLVVFGVTVPRAADRSATVHRAALIHSCIAALLALPASWLGFPVVLAGGCIALGLHAWGGGTDALRSWPWAWGCWWSSSRSSRRRSRPPTATDS